MPSLAVHRCEMVPSLSLSGSLSVGLGGVLLFHLALILAIDRVRRDDRISRAFVAPTTILALAGLARTLMVLSSSDAAFVHWARASFFLAFLVAPVLVHALRDGMPSATYRAALLFTVLVPAAAWLDPAVFTGEVLRTQDIFGADARVATLSPLSGWLLPFGMGVGVVVTRASKTALADASELATAMRFATVFMIAGCATFILSGTGAIPITHFEQVAATGAIAALAWTLRVRSGRAFDTLIEAGQALELQQLACSEDSRRVERMARLGETAKLIVERLRQPARSLERELQRATSQFEVAAGPRIDDFEAIGSALEDARSAASQLNRTLRRVQRFAHVDVVPSMQCQARDCLRTAARMLDHEARHRVTLRLEMYGDATVQGSASELTRLFLMVMRASIGAMPKEEGDGQLRVILTAQDDCTEICVKAKSRWQAVAIRKALDPYAARDAVKACTGLDLATAHRLVTAFGGHMETGKSPTVALRIVLPAIDGSAQS